MSSSLLSFFLFEGGAFANLPLEYDHHATKLGAFAPEVLQLSAAEDAVPLSKHQLGL